MSVTLDILLNEWIQCGGGYGESFQFRKRTETDIDRLIRELLIFHCCKYCKIFGHVITYCPDIAKKYSVEELNKILSLYLWDNLKDEQYNDVLYSNKSPLWNREIGGIAYEDNQFNVCIDFFRFFERFLVKK